MSSNQNIDIDILYTIIYDNNTMLRNIVNSKNVGFENLAYAPNLVRKKFVACGRNVVYTYILEMQFVFVLYDFVY